jgi:hypothetical protein
MLAVELLQSGEHVSQLISFSTMMHSGRYNLPAINPEKHASSRYKKPEERRTEKKRRQGGRASRTREKVGCSTRGRQKRVEGKNVSRGNH